MKRTEPKQKWSEPRVPDSAEVQVVSLSQWLETEEGLKDVRGENYHFLGSDGLTVENSILERVSFVERGYSLISFANSVIRLSDFRMARISRSRFFECVVTDCNLTGVQLNEATVSGCRWRALKGNYAQLLKGKFKNCRFESCIFEGALFDDSTMENVSFIECDLTNASFIGAKFKEVDFRTSKLGGARLEQASLRHLTVDVPQAAQLLVDLTGITVVC